METSQGFPEQEAAAERRKREAVRERHKVLRNAMTAEEVQEKSRIICERLL